MSDEQRVVAGLVIGALVGGLVIALSYTARGRDSLARLDRAFDDLGAALRHLRETVHKAGEVANESLNVAAELKAMVDDRRVQSLQSLH